MAITISTVDLVLPAAAAILYSVGSTSQSVILKATATNTDSAAHTVTLYRVPSGGAPGVTNIIAADGLSVDPLKTTVLPISGQGIVNGQSLWGVASSATFVNISITLAQVT